MGLSETQSIQNTCQWVQQQQLMQRQQHQLLRCKENTIIRNTGRVGSCEAQHLQCSVQSQHNAYRNNTHIPRANQADAMYCVFVSAIPPKF